MNQSNDLLDMKSHINHKDTQMKTLTDNITNSYKIQPSNDNSMKTPFNNNQNMLGYPTPNINISNTIYNYGNMPIGFPNPNSNYLFNQNQNKDNGNSFNNNYQGQGQGQGYGMNNGNLYQQNGNYGQQMPNYSQPQLNQFNSSQPLGGNNYNFGGSFKLNDNGFDGKLNNGFDLGSKSTKKEKVDPFQNLVSFK